MFKKNYIGKYLLFKSPLANNGQGSSTQTNEQCPWAKITLKNIEAHCLA